MTRGTMPMVEPKLTMLSPEAIAKAGYDCPPIRLPRPKAFAAERRPKQHAEQRALNDARRQMLYHWF